MWIKQRKGTNRLKESTNLLLVTFDQWRGDWGNPNAPIIKLPCLEGLAKDGWIAERCYTSSPQCVPARLSWLTGLPPSRMGITKNKSANLPGDAPSFIRDLKEKGWKTAIVGKTHWTDHNLRCHLKDNINRLQNLGFMDTVEIAGPRALSKVKCALTQDWEDRGVYDIHLEDLRKRYEKGREKPSWEVRETVLPNDLYPDIWIADQGIKMLDKMPNNEPWILWISFVGPHEPFDTPKPWKGLHSSEHIPEPINNNGWIERLPKDSELYKIKEMWGNKLDERDIELIRKDYCDHLKLLDDQLKKIFNNLRERKDKNKTAIAITADHGEMLGDHQMIYKSTFLEPSVRVPFVYIPPTKKYKLIKNKYPQNSNPVGLTDLIKEVILNLESGGLVDPLHNWAKKQEGAIAEFGNEIMIVRKWKKVIFDKNAIPIWSTDLKNDPKEEENLFEAKSKNKSSTGKGMKRLIRWGKEEIKKRRSLDWISLEISSEEY